MFLDALLDALFDSAKLFPFLYLTYLFMEWIEHAAGDKFVEKLKSANKVGPLLGSILGLIPQCGFSGASATLYAPRVITLGTLIAVFLSTSDEMLPIMISEMAPISLILTVLATKLICGIFFGFLIDFTLRKTKRIHIGLSSKNAHMGHGDFDIDQLCDDANCQCDEHCEHESGKHAWGHIALSALKHSVQVIIFILIITLCLNLLLEAGAIENLFRNNDQAYGPYLITIITSILGLIPNCGVSVGLTELYLEGYLCGGALMSGLLVNAGCGLLVLIRTNKDWRENLRIALLLVAIGLVCGCLIQAIGIL